ncbi:MAG: outer membrane beta-barrel protein [Planctomycetota bacterium]|jgi:hypothetical protein
MTNQRVIHLLAACLAACTAPLQAGGLEFTPFLGFQSGGDFEDVETGQDYDVAEGSVAGAIFNIDLSDISQLEFYFSRQETEIEGEGLFPTETLFDLDIDYYHIGGTVLMGQDKWQPFVVGTLGATHLDPEPSSIGSLTRFSLGFGGGVRYLPTKHLGLYAGGRVFFTFIDSETHITSTSGSTTVRIRADGLVQGLLHAGLILRF